MSLGPGHNGRRSVSPSSSGRASPAPRAGRRAAEDELYKNSKHLRRYAATVERCLSSWENAPDEWADYIAFLSRLLKAIQGHPTDCPFLPHSAGVASKLAQCLNPSLPSGVHQKALEVYACIFSSFGERFLSGYLLDFLPGLAGVLAFASLSVRPAVYEIYEDYLLHFPVNELRAPLKALILSLLPAIEDDTSEDFDRAFHIIDGLRKKFIQDDEDDGDDDDGTEESAAQSGYFWQCFFLCIITSPSRRQGALHYLARRLPKTVLGTPNSLPSHAEAIVAPEPGLLIRSFVAGLCDHNPLILRGFLDILVTHLPLNSAIFQGKVQTRDLDLLVSSALQVLLRRDMSLNRRVWSWFLGPDRNEDSSGDHADASARGAEKDQPQRQHSSQLQYFIRHGRISLERSVLAMFQRTQLTAAEMAKPFRICLSLMDRWEIGGSIVPNIFLPAVETAYNYSLCASAAESAEVVRSASLFFDGVEARLIWATFFRVLDESLKHEHASNDRLELLIWACKTFNVKDEEMVTVHVPCTALYTLSSLNVRGPDAIQEKTWDLALDFVTILAEIFPKRLLHPAIEPSTIKAEHSGSRPTSEDICKMVSGLYDEKQTRSEVPELPFEARAVPSLLAGQMVQLITRAFEIAPGNRLVSIISLFTVLARSASSLDFPTLDLLASTERSLQSVTGETKALSFPLLNSVIALVIALHQLERLSAAEMQVLGPLVVAQLWPHLSQTSPSYHVEAVRCIWRLHQIMPTTDVVKVSLLTLLRGDTTNPLTSRTQRPESLRRFAVLWNHTVSMQLNSKLRPKAQGTMSDSPQWKVCEEALYEPLLLVLDSLGDACDVGYEIVKGWLQALASLPTILEILLHRLLALRKSSASSMPDSTIAKRHVEQTLKDAGYLLSHINNILANSTNWTWQSVRTVSIVEGDDNKTSGVVVLARLCCELLVVGADGVSAQTQAVAIISLILMAPTMEEVDYAEIEATLVDQLLRSLDADPASSNLKLLQLTGQALKLRLTREAAEGAADEQSRASTSSKRPSTAPTKPESMPIETTDQSSKLLTCLRKGFTSPHARFEMDQWLTFLARVLPSLGEALLPNLIPLVDCFCAELEKSFAELVRVTTAESTAAVYLPDATIIDLFEGLEMTLARAHDSLMDDLASPPPQQQALPSGGFFGAVTSGVFKSDSQGHSRTTQTNSRLTVVLAFQDAIRVALKIWTWAGQNTEIRDSAAHNLATTNHVAFKVRHKTRQLLEHIFAVEPLESLEVVMAQWRQESLANDVDPTLNLLHTMHGMRPKIVLPTILNALCSRTNPNALSGHQLSNKAVDLSSPDVAMFLSAYVESTDDDAMDEIWGDCIAFLRDVLSNPMPFRLILPIMLTFVLLLARKLDNTNYGEPRRMRRELGDVFQRLLTATFTTMSTAQLQEPIPTMDEVTALAPRERERRAPSLQSALARIMSDVEAILETPDRVTTTVNNISTNVLSPVLRAKAFPSNVHPDTLTLVFEMARKAPNAKSWKKELLDAFFDPRFFSTDVTLVADGWFPVLNQWALRDKERMPELLSRLAPPSTAGIMFGVGANAARLEADRKTQLNLRRICLLLLASPDDTYVTLVADFQVKLVELFEATHSSSPSSAIKAELFLLCRCILLSISSSHIAALWPVINDGLHAALSCLIPQDPSPPAAFPNLALLQACKLLDLLITVSPDDFQLHEWLYITDTIAAVYQPPDWSALALSDRIAESLGVSNHEENPNLISSSTHSIGTAATRRTSTTTAMPAAGDANDGRRRPLLGEILMDKEDLKAMSQEECARLVLRPFLSQLSILAYEGVYSMDGPDMAACRASVLDDLLDASTMIDH